MKVKDRIILGSEEDHRPSLYCQVTAIESDGVHARVINGAYDIKLNWRLDQMTVFTPWGHDMHEPAPALLFQGPWPSDIPVEDYEWAIEYATEQIEKHGSMWHWMRRSTLPLTLWLGRLKQASTAAAHTFKMVYRGCPAPVFKTDGDWDDPFDDDIPF